MVFQPLNSLNPVITPANNHINPVIIMKIDLLKIWGHHTSF